VNDLEGGKVEVIGGSWSIERQWEAIMESEEGLYLPRSDENCEENHRTSDITAGINEDWQEIKQSSNQ
jgi:hypothetical protein